MKTKLISTISFIIMFYLLPLVFKPELIFSTQILVLSILCGILFFTQPPFSMNETKSNKSSDQFSILIIIGSIALTQLVMMMEWAYFQSGNHSLTFDIITIIGIILLIGGTVFRVLCIHTLGKYFTATVRTQETQTLVCHGVYKFIRHPSYLGAYLAIIGSAVFMHCSFSIIFSSAILFAAYKFRISAEENELTKVFPDEYHAYQLKSYKMIPFIF